MSNLRRDLILWAVHFKIFIFPAGRSCRTLIYIWIRVLRLLIEGYLQNLFDEENDTILTAAMINNYVKLKLIPKAEKKRYNRMHVPI